MSFNFKTIAGLVGLLMLLAFLLPPAIKLKKIALAIVILIGIAMAAYEFYEQLRNKDN
jgi:uncharacterized membrane protein